VAGFVVTLVLLTSGFTVSASVIGTVVGLLLITVGLRVSRRLGSLHRRLLRRFLGRQVEAPPRFQPGTGVLGRLDRRLRDRAGWGRAPWPSGSASWSGPGRWRWRIRPRRCAGSSGTCTTAPRCGWPRWP